MGPRISLIVARAENGVIGADGKLPWRIPADMKWFKANTLGKPVIMGRKTWESLPKRPLPERRNIVITRNATYRAEGAEVVPSLAAALALCAGADEVMVIGGAEIYALALPQASRIYLTRVHASPTGDAHMPEFSSARWREVSCERHATEGGAPAFDFVVLERKIERHAHS